MQGKGFFSTKEKKESPRRVNRKGKNTKEEI